MITKTVRQTKAGKSFPTYAAKIGNKFIEVKFLDDCAPKFETKCMDVTIPEHGASFMEKRDSYVKADGTTVEFTKRVLFVKVVLAAIPHVFENEWFSLFEERDEYGVSDADEELPL